MKRKLFSLLLSFVMIFTMVPFNGCEVFAADTKKGWTSDSAGHWLYYENNQPIKKRLKKIEDKEYYFNKDGFMFNELGKHKVDNGKFYYFKKGSDGKVFIKRGILKVEEGTYNYFAPSMQVNSWDKSKKYYFGKYGKRVKGMVKIGKYYYYFNPGKKTGVQKINKKLYYFKSSGRRITTKGWFKVGKGKTCYGLGKGRIASGIKTINKKTYYFYKKSGIRRTKAGFFKDENKRYYISKGVLCQGWKIIDNRAYYFYKKGKNKFAQAIGTTVGYLKIPKKGYLGEAYVRGIKSLNKSGWTLRKAYNTSVRMMYAHQWLRRKTSEQYAIYGFKHNAGNCYCMAATFYIKAKLLGYNIRQMEGRIGIGPHSWVEIKQKGKWWVYDPDFAHETGRNGYKIYYGKSGTWRYYNYHVMQH